MGKKYLIRSGFDPYKQYSEVRIYFRDPFGKNSGNLLFPYGVMNVLCIDSECRFDSTHYKTKWNDEEIEYINSYYDAFLIPLADAFRDSYLPQLKALTRLIKRLTIPCIVIGCGLRAPYNPSLDAAYPFDDAVVEFVKAVLDHSQCLGLRGKNTYAYLEKLGFLPETDFTVIGCPSLYTYGNSIVTKPLPNEIKRIAYNINCLHPLAKDFIFNSAFAVENSKCIWQMNKEYRSLYLNEPCSGEAISEEDMKRIHSGNGGAFFWSVPEWISYVSNFDLFVGDRFHGAAAAVLGGVPQVFIPVDSRTQELAEYHHLTCVAPETAARTENVFNIMESLDFSSFQKTQEKNLEHYHSFLKNNGLVSNLDDPSSDLSFGNSAFEKKVMTCAKKQQVIESYLSVNMVERAKRRTVCSVYSSLLQLYRKGKH